jgi:hypothetical protein
MKKKKTHTKFAKYLVTGIKTDRTVIKLRIQEIEEHITELLSLPSQPIQTKYRLDKERADLRRKLRNNSF